MSSRNFQKKAALIENKFLLCVILIIYILLWLISISPVEAGNISNPATGIAPEYFFYKGNRLYEEGKYDDAIMQYSKLLAQGIESGNLYYNMGNSYFKKGELGKAILNYERAKRLIPRDSDLKSNYKFARSQIKYNVSVTSGQWFKRLFDIFNMLSINEMVILLSAVFVLAVVFLIVRLFSPIARRYFPLFISVSTIIFILIILSLFGRVSMLEKEAIVILKSAEVKFEPFESATTHFVLYEGMKINILQFKKDWVKIIRQDGKVGWIKSRDIEKI